MTNYDKFKIKSDKKKLIFKHYDIKNKYIL